MTMRITTLTALALALTTIGCSARTLIGEVDGASPPMADGSMATADGGAPGGANSGGTCSPVVHQGDQPFTFPAGVAGVWTGYIEFATGLASDAVKLILDKDATGADQIHVIYGTAAAPPPATSATELYPPGWAWMQVSGMSVMEGFPYLAHNVRWTALGSRNRVTFGIVTYGGWESWCRLQTSYPVDPANGAYNCIPGSAIQHENAGQANEECTVTDAPGGPIVVPCAQAYLCQPRYCTCDACGCAESSFSFAPGFDLLFDVDTASGGGVQLARAAN